MIKTLFILAIGMMLSLVARLSGQEIKANVTVDLEQLPFEARTNVQSIKRDIENYVDNQKFVEGDWQGDPIPVQMTIYLSGGTNNVYSAKLFLVSTRPIDGPGNRQSVDIKLFDDQWSFQYGLGANLTFNPLRFDAFTSEIDYYMLLVIGYDLDTWSELGGTKAFNEARKIVELGAANNAQGFSSYSQPGDFTKYNLTAELNDMRYDDFRKLLFSYWVDGLDMMYKDKDQAMKNLKDVIYKMALYKKDKLVEQSVMMQLFFDSKAQEIASIFNGFQDNDVFQNLKYMDPGNATLYDDAKDGKAGQ